MRKIFTYLIVFFCIQAGVALAAGFVYGLLIGPNPPDHIYWLGAMAAQVIAFLYVAGRLTRPFEFPKAVVKSKLTRAMEGL